ncbi:MAG: DUF3276 family protein [Tenuifilum sp.]|uniref:DUF3276 family protein n=1 Tax=Tenuifilum sp. TaxID=2760880 RepID=UPI001B554B65|nr:PUR family DNA/RNA-binding protein [Bacteroidales bacterium]HOK61505.1 DUF3276 family protein [Tenuifilum sp.]MBP9028324.1 PUR family DNA/RNA-binding protein [Bacteroidales bacterium]HOK85192.1 DUF3276 family protein [Tenuifilum sp.]HON71065.1 DUF3276 family protein [Tenuifilum sp.]
MIEEFDNTNDLDKNTREEVFSQVVKAGKRTYFFDVKATRGNEYYLTITESKKRMGKDGKMYYEKHKIFLYKEDFEKFIESLNSVFDYIKANQEIVPRTDHTDEMELSEVESDYSSVDFDDLGK